MHVINIVGEERLCRRWGAVIQEEGQSGGGAGREKRKEGCFTILLCRSIVTKGNKKEEKRAKLKRCLRVFGT